jgi:hypothetical protein
MTVLLKISLVPLVVWLASLAGRRWGHAVAGWVSGLPLIAGPISVFLALDQGVEFAADAAAATLQVTGAAALHCLVFAHAARRFGWLGSLLLGWASFIASAAVLGAVPLPPLAGVALTALLLVLMLAALPRVPRRSGPAGVPGVELALRVAVAAAIAAAVTLGANAFGPRMSGILLTFPITGSVLPPFTLALHGADATVRLLAGFLSGLFAFATFHFTVATALPAWSPFVVYPLAIGAGVAVTAVVLRLRT